jgi:hypothetical protein
MTSQRATVAGATIAWSDGRATPLASIEADGVEVLDDPEEPVAAVRLAVLGPHPGFLEGHVADREQVAQGARDEASGRVEIGIRRGRHARRKPTRRPARCRLVGTAAGPRGLASSGS